LNSLWNLFGAARAEQYLNLPHCAILDEKVFDEMRTYLLRYYDGAIPIHSFADANGSIFDCIPIVGFLLACILLVLLLGSRGFMALAGCSAAARVP
jgi:hypothetical protein